jgi:hypothetical protein
MNKNNSVEFVLKITGESEITESINSLADVLDGFMDNSEFSGFDLEKNNSGEIKDGKKGYAIVQGTNTEIELSLKGDDYSFSNRPIKIEFFNDKISMNDQDLVDLIEIIESLPFVKSLTDVKVDGIKNVNVEKDEFNNLKQSKIITDILKEKQNSGKKHTNKQKHN